VGLLIAYAGTAEFAVPALTAIAGSSHRLTLVITQPDRRAGRGRHPTPSPVKHRALALGVPLLAPERLDSDFAAALAAHAPDALVVAAYGLLVPEPLLALPRLGGINIHGSLLPRWRGAAPVQRAIEAGDAVTGVAVMRMEPTLDTGPWYRQEPVAIADSDTSATLGARLADLGARLVVSVLDDLERGSARLTPQASSGASYAAKLTKSEAAIDWRAPAELIARRVRAFDPWPVASTTLDGVALRIWAARAEADAPTAAFGQVLAASGAGIAVATGHGRLWLTRVQPPGRRPVSAGEFVNAVGRDSLIGRVLGT
jgi:methionyl-tRNA formyltransferase